MTEADLHSWRFPMQVSSPLRNRLCAADLPGCSCSWGCGEQMVPMGLDLGPKCRAGLGVQSTGQVISKVFVMSW